MTNMRPSRALSRALSPESAAVPSWLAFARDRIGTRRAAMLLGVAALGIGAALNWRWLTAIGVAPILLALAPCAAMCALGLCMNKMGGAGCSSSDQNVKNGAMRAIVAKPHDESQLKTVDPRAAEH